MNLKEQINKELNSPLNPISVECQSCFFLTRGKTCRAFSKGIPEEIWNRDVAHLTPYPGDNGIMYLREGSIL